DPVHDLDGHPEVPGTFRIDDTDRPGLAYPKTVDLAPQHPPFAPRFRIRLECLVVTPAGRRRRQPESLEPALEMRPHFVRDFARRTLRRALAGTQEDVTLDRGDR